LVRSFSDFVDVEDLLKSVHKVVHPDQHERKSSIVHTPIDWSQYPPSAFRNISIEEYLPSSPFQPMLSEDNYHHPSASLHKFSQDLSKAIREEFPEHAEEEEDEEEEEEEEDF
jgi:hypothetical protein